MIDDKKRFTITAALPYANGPLHIGHLAGAYLNADIFARYLRLCGKDVLFVCGSDEHGAAITIQAKKENKSPQSIVDRYHNTIKESFEQIGVSFDIYHRTHTDIHIETAREFFTQLLRKAKFQIQETEQYYDEAYQQFLADRYIIGTCPVCGHEEAYGDQCEKCGSSLSPNELINPRSTLSNEKPVKRKTKHWYFPLDEYESFLRHWILEEKKDDWKNNVYGQCKSWIESGLTGRSMTRDLSWGVPVPLPQAEGKVLYVWMDAPIGYISATKAWAEANNEAWEPWWKDQDTALIHFIGKDNIVFHCIIFPMLLRAHGDFILPENVPANEFLNLQGGKLSTSKNRAVWVHEYLQKYPKKIDELRYVLISILPEQKDSEFTWEIYQTKVNNELANTLGNFINRSLTLVQKYTGGKLSDDHFSPNKELLHARNEIIIQCAEAITHYRFREAQEAMMRLARLGDKYLTDTEPWKLYKQKPEAAIQIVYNALQIVASIAIVSEVFIPFTAKKIQNALGITQISWNKAFQTFHFHKPIGKLALLFEKIEDDMVAEEIETLEKTKAAQK